MQYTNPKNVIEDLNRAADDTAGNISKFLDILHYSSNLDNLGKDVNRYSTELDHKQLALQKEEAVSSKYLVYNYLVRGRLFQTRSSA